MFNPVESQQIAVNEEAKEDFVNILPPEISLEIFSYLNSQELANCFRVSKTWKVFTSDHALWNALLLKIAFGKKQWETYFGDIGKEPPYPKDIHKILNSPCPFWPEKKVKETHMLVLIPETVNGKPLTLSTLNELVKTPKRSPATKYRYIGKPIIQMIQEYGNQAVCNSHWVLMTKDVIKGSRGKSYADQKTLVAQLAEQTGINYEIPAALDAAICILMYYIRFGERLFNTNRNFWTYTRCQESVQKGGQMVIGGFSSIGLVVNCNNWQFPYFGVAALRKFF